MKLSELLGLRLTGALIEWPIVALINIGLIVFELLSGISSVFRSLGDFESGAVVVGPFVGLIAYAAVYISAYSDDSYCIKSYAPTMLLWKVRVANILYQIVHAALFVGLVWTRKTPAIIVAFWLYAIFPVTASVWYWTVILAAKIRKEVLNEYHSYKALENAQKKENVIV